MSGGLRDHSKVGRDSALMTMMMIIVIIIMSEREKDEKWLLWGLEFVLHHKTRKGHRYKSSGGFNNSLREFGFRGAGGDSLESERSDLRKY